MLQGFDISHHNNDRGKVEWDKLSADYDFALVKVTGGYKGSDGVMFVDPKGTENVNNARAHDMGVGVYHYARFNSVAQAHEEADFFREYAEPHKPDFVLLDIEDPGQNGDLTDAANAFLDDISDIAKTALYSFPSFINSHFNEGIAHQNLWIAHWGVEDPEIVPWADWVIWQFSSTAHTDGLIGIVDLNYMHEDFAKHVVQKVKPKPHHKKPHKTARDAVLENGDQGGKVSSLQMHLIELNYSLAPYGVDGDYGDVTEAAVRRFQGDQNIAVDGKAGPVTRSHIADALAYPGHLFYVQSPMIHNADVGKIQRSLNLYGADLKIDEWYGNGTANAVGDFQRQHDLKVDEIVGDDTWSELFK